MSDPLAAGSGAWQRGRTAGMGELAAVKGRDSRLAPFGTALVEAGRADPRIVALTADLAKYTDLLPFAEAFPDRFFNVGMAEQNLMAVAAGLAKTGWRPFVTTYAVFASRRALDFVSIAIAHAHLPVKIFAGLPGLTTGYGGTHQGIEDLALMQAVPGLAVIDPCDAVELGQVVHALAAHPGPAYVRIQRGNVPVVMPDGYRFALGRAQKLRAGGDVGIITTGLMTERSLDAASLLATEGLEVAVLHVPCLKPFDAAAVADFAGSVGSLVTAENHVARGGLGTAVVEALFEAGISRPVRRVGLPDRFIECGSVPYLQDKYGLTTERLAETVRAAARSR
jgi:transketolase